MTNDSLIQEARRSAGGLAYLADGNDTNVNVPTAILMDVAQLLCRLADQLELEVDLDRQLNLARRTADDKATYTPPAFWQNRHDECGDDD